MIEVEVQEFIAVEKVGPVIVAFSNQPYCEFAFSLDEGIVWTSGKVSVFKDEIITSPWQICSDEFGYLYLGTSMGNIYRANIDYENLGWAIVNSVSFADNDPILYMKSVADESIFVVSKKGVCIFSRDNGLTWDYIKPTLGDDLYHIRWENMNSYDLIKDAKVPMLARKEIDELKRLARTLPANPIVIIIGAGVGAASMSILEARKDAIIFSIDSQFPTKQPMYKPGERANLIQADLWEQGHVIQVWGESQIVGKQWPLPYDMILIDGDHRYPAIKEDIRLWLPHAKNGAIISLHDYAPEYKKPRAGVKRAVDEMIRLDRISLVHWLISFQS